jgi:putative ubiquitin-RnfH superfamily antitoxin RatB of RatAB toxin-antitoxin module
MNPPEPARLRITVVYLRPGHAFERTVVLPAPATVAAAIEASGVRSLAELAGRQLQVGVFGEPGGLADALHDGDRVEIYRPLSIDPKEARRIRAAVRRKRRAGAMAQR